MPLESGTYFITNDSLGKVVDLLEGKTALDTPIIGHELNRTGAQKWVVTVDGNHVRMRCLLSPTSYVSTTGDGDGDKLVVGQSESFDLTEYGTGKYRIAVHNKKLYWRLENGNNRTQIDLQPSGADNLLWRFKEIQ